MAPSMSAQDAEPENRATIDTAWYKEPCKGDIVQLRGAEPRDPSNGRHRLVSGAL